MAKITYTNKDKNATAGTDPTLWKDADANEVKESTNHLYDVIGYGLYAYLVAPTKTVIALANTYYPISGSFTNVPAVGFELTATPGIKFTGTKTAYFEATFYASFKSDTNNTTVKIGLKKNGVIETSSEIYAFCKTMNELYTVSGNVVCSLETDDELQIVVSTDTAGDITFQNITTKISNFIV